MRTIDLRQFLREVKDRHTLQKAKPFCFVLGAGASKQSEIPMGGELVDRWLRVLHPDASPDDKAIAQWATADALGIKGFDYKRRAEFYGQIYALRFQGTPDTGHAELQSLLSGKEPSFGYSILAYILANTPHKAVITTNFDNLVADALYLYSNTAPILCVHESLAPFITAQLDRPLVVKIHRDLLLDPLSDADKIAEINQAWVAPLRSLFSHFTPIFIGYGGNDGSLMGFLDDLEPPVPDRIYWCVRPDSPPNAIVRALLDKRSGTLVTISGFNEVMFALTEPLGIPDLLPDLNDRHKKRVERYTEQRSALAKTSKVEAKAPDATPDQKTLGQVIAASDQQLEKDDTPESWILRAKAEPDKAKAEALYRQALIQHPHNGPLMCALGAFLADEKQAFAEAEALIQSAYEAEPGNPDRMHDYGQFLWYSKRDGRKAEPLLRSAVAKRTESLGANHPSVLKSRNNLAAALQVQDKHAEAEEEHRAVLALRERVLGAEHRDTLASRSNLALALDNQGRHAESVQEHRARIAIEERVLGAEHSDTLASRNNLANALLAQGKNAEAEQEYRAVLAIQERVLGAQHPDILRSRMNLGSALMPQAKYAEAEKEYRETAEIKGRVLGAEHPDTLASRMGLANALSAQGKNADAEQEYRAVLALRERVLGAEHPDVFLSCFNLALCLEAQGKLKEALAFMQRAENGRASVLGSELDYSKRAKGGRERIEAAVAEEKADENQKK